MGIEQYLPRPYCQWSVGTTSEEKPLPYDVVGFGKGDARVSEVASDQRSNPIRMLAGLIRAGISALTCTLVSRGESLKNRERVFWQRPPGDILDMIHMEDTP